MNEERPYMDEQWDDLPLPDGEAAWQRMELLLEKEEKRRVLPFWFWRYAGLGLLLLSLTVGAWLWLRKEDVEKKEKTATKNTITKNAVREKISVQNRSTVSSNTNKPTTTNETSPSNKTFENTQTVVKEENKNIREQEEGSGTQTTSVTKSNKKEKRTARTKMALPATASDNSTLTAEQKVETGKEKDQSSMAIQPNKIDSSSKIFDQANKSTGVVKDTAVAKDTSTKKLSEPTIDSLPKKDSQKNKPAFVFSAGVGLQQAIAFNQQTSSSFNYNGKRSTVSDRIPSLYLRLQKGKWFVQTEFHYAVPQPVEAFSFSQKTRYDPATANINTERFSIQKLYYHQLPFSVNYFVLPNWSVGVGGTYNLLAGAVTEQEIERRNALTGITSIINNLAPVKGFKDSFFYKTTVGILLQTDYHWKRLSFGLRFTQNLQPFIKYTKPDGAVLDERNKVLQAALRFRLWQK